MTSQEYMQEADEYVLHTYNRYPIVLDHGEGVKLYDTDGKEYLDFAAGIAVYGLGYSNEKFMNAVKAQLDKVAHISNLYYSAPLADAACFLSHLAICILSASGFRLFISQYSLYASFCFANKADFF